MFFTWKLTMPVLLTFRCYSKVPDRSNLQRGKIYFSSQFWLQPSVISWLCCFWICGETAHRGIHDWEKLLLSRVREDRERQNWGYHKSLERTPHWTFVISKGLPLDSTLKGSSHRLRPKTWTHEQALGTHSKPKRQLFDISPAFLMTVYSSYWPMPWDLSLKHGTQIYNPSKSTSNFWDRPFRWPLSSDLLRPEALRGLSKEQVLSKHHL